MKTNRSKMKNKTYKSKKSPVNLSLFLSLSLFFFFQWMEAYGNKFSLCPPRPSPDPPHPPTFFFQWTVACGNKLFVCLSIFLSLSLSLSLQCSMMFEKNELSVVSFFVLEQPFLWFVHGVVSPGWFWCKCAWHPGSVGWLVIVGFFVLLVIFKCLRKKFSCSVVILFNQCISLDLLYL